MLMNKHTPDSAVLLLRNFVLFLSCLYSPVNLYHFTLQGWITNHSPLMLHKKNKTKSVVHKVLRCTSIALIDAVFSCPKLA